MKTKNVFIKYLGISVLGFLSGVAYADRVGNGGVSVVCRSADGQILSAQLLDLFEGEHQYHLSYEAPPGADVDQLVNLSQLQMASNQKFLADFQSNLSQVRAKMTFLGHGVGLEPTNDAFPIIHKDGCAFEQLANYAEDGNIYVNSEIFDRLDKVNQAGLYVHEAAYAVARAQNGARSSVRARRLTGQVLAKKSDSGVIQELMKELSSLPTSPKPDPYRGLLEGLYVFAGPERSFCSYQIFKELPERLSMVPDGECASYEIVGYLCRYGICQSLSESKVFLNVVQSNVFSISAPGQSLFYYRSENQPTASAKRGKNQ
jgi:hypothetical protein